MLESFWREEALEYLYLLIMQPQNLLWRHGSSILRLIRCQCKVLQPKKLSGISILAKLR